MAEFPIVGIGSSAGGLEPLQKLFTAMPDKLAHKVYVLAS